MKIRTTRLARPISATLAVLALGGALGACAPEFEGYEARPYVSKQPVAEWSTSQVGVRFLPGTATLAPGEDARITAALANEDPTRPVRVIARTNAAGSTPKFAVERAAALRAVVAGKGYEVEYQGLSAAGAGSALPNPTERDSALLYVAHYEVSVPGCPDWQKPTVTDFTNTNSSNFGCANAINLALMVSDPGDLSSGTPLAPADGTRQAKVITDYRAGKTPLVAKPDLPPIKAVQQLTTNN